MASPNWVRMREGFRPSIDGRTGVVTVQEVWVCTDFPLSTSTGYDDTYQNVEASCPPQFGASHPDPGLSRAVVVNKRRAYGPTNGICKVVVTYSSDVRWGGLYRARTISTRSSVRLVPIPVFQKITVSTNAGPAFGYQLMSDVRSWPTMPRSEIRRTAYVVTTGNPDLITHLIVLNCAGKGYQFTESPFTTAVSAIPYVLDDFEVRELASGGVAIRYEFLTRCPTAEIPANTYANQPVAIPALSFLQEWNISYPIGSPPQITAVMPPIEVGGTLPS